MFKVWFVKRRVSFGESEFGKSQEGSGGLNSRPVFTGRPNSAASSEAERSVLGAILLNNESNYRLLEIGLRSADFYHESHQKIYEVCPVSIGKGTAR
jgi:hypothetical protein